LRGLPGGGRRLPKPVSVAEFRDKWEITGNLLQTRLKNRVVDCHWDT
jgi:hypothetical protein